MFDVKVFLVILNHLPGEGKHYFMNRGSNYRLDENCKLQK